MPLNEGQICSTCRFWDGAEADRLSPVRTYKECHGDTPKATQALVGQFALIDGNNWCRFWAAMPKPKKDAEAP